LMCGDVGRFGPNDPVRVREFVQRSDNTRGRGPNRLAPVKP
jgi:hypothetical protein